MHRAKRQDQRLIAVAAATLVALATVLALVFAPAPPPPAAIAPASAARAVPEPPPLVFLDVGADRARRLNAQIPFRALGPAAQPFLFEGPDMDRQRALDCLSSAMLYEAGDDAAGQYAVAQVVLNRLRHPAFPHTVCGAVFQGSDRATGCQFTFTCDGALARTPPLAAMAEARRRAGEMLGGRVESAVGLATHYHTDWVFPVWSPELEKIARVGTHLFFRWGNGWGGPSVMRHRHEGAEPLVPLLARLFPAHDPLLMGAGPAAADGPTGEPGEPVPGGGAALTTGEGRYEVLMNPLRNGNVQALAALDLCGARDTCRITGYLDTGGMRGPVVFTFERDRAQNIERARWDCGRFRRPTTTQCLDGTAP